MRSSAPGAKFSTSTSHFFTSASRTAFPFGFLPSTVIERLFELSIVKYRLSTPGMSRSCPRVTSPSPARSTLITSAPSHARSCVHVGPDCTSVKSRMRTPSSALPIRFLLFLLGSGVEARDAPAFRSRLFVDHRIDQRRLARAYRLFHRVAKLGGRRRQHADATEGIHQLLVARALDE